jgi:hypothetical protein
MSKITNRRNKKYNPRRMDSAGGLAVIARCVARGQDAAPLAEDQLADLGLAYWLSLEQLRTGAATEEAWSCVVTALNIAMAMAEADIGSEHEAAIIRALDGAFRAKVRSAKSGNFRLDGDAMRDIATVLTIHDAQLEVATRAETIAALQLVFQRVDEGHVYREAA